MLMCTTDYSFDWEKMNPEQQATFLECWPTARKAHNAAENKLNRWELNTQRLTVDEVYRMSRAGITSISIEGVDGTMLTKMQDRGDHKGTPVLDLHEARIVQITIPDVGLLMMDEVDWLDDACTERVQEKLDEGWRILAVCPPNAQRRPDYIFGRTKPKQ